MRSESLNLKYNFNLFQSKKQIIQAESDELRRQDANKTALAAIGSRKKRKVDETSTSLQTTNTRAVNILITKHSINNLIKNHIF